MISSETGESCWWKWVIKIVCKIKRENEKCPEWQWIPQRLWLSMQKLLKVFLDRMGKQLAGVHAVITLIEPIRIKVTVTERNKTELISYFLIDCISYQTLQIWIELTL